MCTANISKLFSVDERYAEILSKVWNTRADVEWNTLDDDFLAKIRDSAKQQKQRLTEHVLMHSSEYQNENGTLSDKFATDITTFFPTSKPVNTIPNSSVKDVIDYTIEAHNILLLEEYKYSLFDFEQHFKYKIEPKKGELQEILKEIPFKEPSARMKANLTVEYAKLSEGGHATVIQENGQYKLRISLGDTYHFPRNSFVHVNTRHVFSVNPNYVLIMYLESDQLPDCYVQPVTIDAKDKGPLYIHFYTRYGGRVDDFEMRMQLFSVSRELNMRDAENTLAIQDKDMHSSATAIWNLKTTCASLAIATIVTNNQPTVTDETNNQPTATDDSAEHQSTTSVQFTNKFSLTNAITSNDAPFLILPRKRAMFSFSLIAPGAYIKSLYPLEYVCANPLDTMLLCVTSPKKTFPLTLTLVDSFTKNSLSNGLNGNFADLPAYKDIVKNVKKLNKKIELKRSNIRFFEHFEKEFGFQNVAQKQCFLEILDLFGKPMKRDHHRLEEFLEKAKSESSYNNLFDLKTALEFDPGRRSVSEKIEDSYQLLYDICTTLCKTKKGTKRTVDGEEKSV